MVTIPTIAPADSSARAVGEFRATTRAVAATDIRYLWRYFRMFMDSFPYQKFPPGIRRTTSTADAFDSPGDERSAQNEPAHPVRTEASYGAMRLASALLKKGKFLPQPHPGLLEREGPARA